MRGNMLPYIIGVAVLWFAIWWRRGRREREARRFAHYMRTGRTRDAAAIVRDLFRQKGLDE